MAKREMMLLRRGQMTCLDILIGQEVQSNEHGNTYRKDTMKIYSNDSNLAL